MSRVVVHPQVVAALRAGRPVVALESAVATAGLPATPLGSPPDCDAPGWRPGSPTALEAARLLARLVRDAGSVPATVGVIEGVLHVGVDDDSLKRLVAGGAGAKVSVAGLAPALAGGRTAGTTVSATLAACRLAGGGLRVLATGGLGGVHRGWTARPDVSADLRTLAVTPVCVVASGPKAVLDVTATAEALEALGVTVVGYRTDRWPGFFCRRIEAAGSLPQVDDPAAVAEVCRAQWRELRREGAVVLANPPPEAHALQPREIEPLVREAEQRAGPGPQRTPALLRAVVEGTGGRALQANIALLADNARVAAAVAQSLTEPPAQREGGIDRSESGAPRIS